MAKKYKITIDYDGCIAAISCIAVADALWELGPDQKAHLKLGKVTKTTHFESSIVTEDDLKKAGVSIDEMMESAAVCPTQAIKIEEVKE